MIACDWERVQGEDARGEDAFGEGLENAHAHGAVELRVRVVDAEEEAVGGVEDHRRNDSINVTLSPGPCFIDLFAPGATRTFRSPGSWQMTPCWRDRRSAARALRAGIAYREGMQGAGSGGSPGRPPSKYFRQSRRNWLF